MTSRRLLTLAAFVLATFAACTPFCVAAEWPCYRGNPERTGCIDNKPGPEKPRVLWQYGGKENYVGSPAVIGDKVCVTGLGAFNSGILLAFEPRPSDKQLAWSVTPPLLKLPAVSSPVSAGNLVIFGEGMHQTDGASLYAVAANRGRLLWRYEVAGRLVHMEGAPAVLAGNRVFQGAGNGGVISLDLSRLTLAGQEQSAADVVKKLDGEWQKLLAKYEADKKADPDFAIPPTDDALPKASPKLVWQQGKDKWHVDAPIAAVDGKVIACSAYLDTEKLGERAIICLSADSGDILWKTPLDQNPWAGASIAGDTAILGGSSIRLEPKDVPRGRGSLVAVNLIDGSVKWKKTFPGGVVSSVAIVNGLAISCATDGTVRANDTTTGDLKWSYLAGAPMFAGPAIAGEKIYVGDLKGVVHSIGMNGKGVWKFPLNDTATKDAMIYGSPIVHDGKIYVGTCNLTAAGKGQQAIVCIGE